MSIWKERINIELNFVSHATIDRIDDNKHNHIVSTCLSFA